MQLFTGNGLSTPTAPATFGHNQTGMRYGGRGVQRRNENGLLAVVERHQDEIHRSATLPQPAGPRRP